MRSRLTAFLLMLSLLGLASCTPAQEQSLFVRSENARDGVYVFPLGALDSLSSYDISIYGRAARKALKEPELRVMWLSPDGQTFTETIYPPKIGLEGSRFEYRSGVSPARSGQWSLSIRECSGAEPLTGLGIIIKKSDGTR